MGVLVAQQPAPKPETVAITFHAKAGAEAELARATPPSRTTPRPPFRLSGRR